VNRAALAKAFANGSVEWRKHALQRMFERGISRSDVSEVVRDGELLEEYSGDKPFPSGLFFRIMRGRPIHVVAAVDDSEPLAYVITAYEPSKEQFEDDFKTRRRQ
jgi:hypothetical protein